MGEIVDMQAAICKRDICDAAILMASTHATFTARFFTEFLQIAGYQFEEEDVNEWLVELVERGHLREIGPAMYAKPRPN